ncbi:hypothetical protein F5887DRAFT_918762 [Amanita rubescens]|nr:hypothetical protein F5887DRAFT_918762 [Amanita rubescens]
MIAEVLPEWDGFVLGECAEEREDGVGFGADAGGEEGWLVEAFAFCWCPIISPDRDAMALIMSIRRVPTTVLDCFPLAPPRTLSALRRPVNEVLTGDGKRKHRTIGTLTPGMEARIIVEDDGIPDRTPAAPNQVGNLWLKGGNVTLGFWNNEQAMKETFVDGWLKTGDKFWVDED